MENKDTTELSQPQNKQDMSILEALEILVMRLRSDEHLRDSLRYNLNKRFILRYREHLKASDLTDEEKLVLEKISFKQIAREAVDKFIIDACSNKRQQLFPVALSKPRHYDFEGKIALNVELQMREFYVRNWKDFVKKGLSYTEWINQGRIMAEIMWSNIFLVKFKEEHGMSLLEYMEKHRYTPKEANKPQ